MAAGCGLWLAQGVWITDPYGLKDIWNDPVRRNLFLWAGGGLTAAVVAARWISARVRVPRLAGREGMARWVGGLGCLTFVLHILLSMRYRNAQGLIPGMPAWSAAYVSLTDFDGVRRIFSRVGFAAALAGLFVLALPVGPAPQCLWMLASHGREENVALRVSFQPRRDASPTVFSVAPGWNWHRVPLAMSETGIEWHDLEITPAWDPGLPNFPADLVLRIHRLAVVPCDVHGP